MFGQFGVQCLQNIFEFYLKKDSFARCNNPIETTGITFFLVFTKSIIF